MINFGKDLNVLYTTEKYFDELIEKHGTKDKSNDRIGLINCLSDIPIMTVSEEFLGDVKAILIYQGKVEVIMK